MNESSQVLSDSLKEAVANNVPIQETPAAKHSIHPQPTADESTNAANANVDAIKEIKTITEIKNFLGTVPNKPPPRYAYHHADSAPTREELEEFYSYSELSDVTQLSKHSFGQSLGAFLQHHNMGDMEWQEIKPDIQRSYLIGQLENLENKDAEQRFNAARSLVYVVIGTPHETDSIEDHLQRILRNCIQLRKVGTLQAVYDAMRSAGGRWTIVSDSTMMEEMGASPPQPSSDWPKLEERQEYLDELNSELAIYINILYFMVEMFRGEAEWAEDLMTLNPPLPIYLFDLLAGLREKNAKGYPVKKLLLLSWKTLLSCLGGQKDLARVKTLVREIEGLPKDTFVATGEKGSKPFTKVHPTDFANFKRETSIKYPTYQVPEIPLPIPEIPLDSVVAAASPIPLRPFYPFTTASYAASNRNESHPENGPAPAQPLPPTPAPTPPLPSAPLQSHPPNSPSGVNQQPQQPQKPKKQQFQTDQTRPFVLPFSSANPNNSRNGYFVPKSVSEAGQLFRQHVRISTELWQTVKLREECIADETGIAQFQQSLQRQRTELESRTHSTQSLQDMVRNSTIGTDPLTGMEESLASLRLRKFDEDSSAVEDEEEEMDPLIMLRHYQSQQRHKLANIDDTKEKKRMETRIGDVKRLERVEIIYRAILPHMQSSVIVLLKLLLATVTPNAPINANNNQSEDEHATPVQLTLEDTDVMRHREITSKSVSIILILMLQWFKASHVMKFQYFAQLLVDSNCLLLILKIFGLQEVSMQVRLNHEVPDYNFFRYCSLIFSRAQPPGGRANLVLEAFSKPLLEDPNKLSLQLPPPNPNNSPETTSRVLDEEPELIHEYSARNFFSIINFVHVLQKLTKRKIHRVLLLVQYKSSAILKRLLRVSHPVLQLYTLKVIKSQIPYCGRKWRQSNMKVITAIYLNCRPDLKDDWLTGADIDGDAEDSLPNEQALRALVKFFNMKHYSKFAPSLHRRSSSHNHNGSDNVSSHPHAGHPPPSPSALMVGEESFPPQRSMLTFGTEPAYRHSYISNSFSDMYLADEYEAILDDLLTPRYSVDVNGVPSLYPDSLEGRGGQLDHAWSRLSELLGETDDISDSESVGTVGLLDFGSDMGSDDGSGLGESPNWAEMSPEIILALEEERDQAQFSTTGSPRSPRPRSRRSSTEPISPALRPVLTTIDGDQDDEDAEIFADEIERGPAETAPHTGSPIDEVEAVFDE